MTEILKSEVSVVKSMMLSTQRKCQGLGQMRAQNILVKNRGSAPDYGFGSLNHCGLGQPQMSKDFGGRP